MVLGTMAFASCAMVVVVRRVVLAARRRVLGLVDRAQLAARSQGIGPTAEVARLRRDLRRSLTGLRRALDAARTVRAPIGDVPSLLARLELAAQSVDGELRMLEARPEGSIDARQLAGPRARVRTITSSATTLVDGLLQAAHFEADELALLQASCAIEGDALRAAAAPRSPAPRPLARDRGDHRP